MSFAWDSQAAPVQCRVSERRPASDLGAPSEPSRPRKTHPNETHGGGSTRALNRRSWAREPVPNRL